MSDYRRGLGTGKDHGAPALPYITADGPRPVREASSKGAGSPAGAPPVAAGVWRKLLLRPTPEVRRVMVAILGL